MVFQAYVRAVKEHAERLQRLDPALCEPVNTWRLAPVVAALQALRGVPCTVTVTIVADLGDLTRFENPRPVMKDLGLIPSAYSRGERRRPGALTTAGTRRTHVRWSPTPGDPRDHPSDFTASASSDGQHPARGTGDEDRKRGEAPLTSEVISTPDVR